MLDSEFKVQDSGFRIPGFGITAWKIIARDEFES
jgi:hypothetical protein